MGGWPYGSRVRRAAADCGENQQSGESVEYKRESEENETELDEDMNVKRGCGLGELIGDDGGNGIAGSEKRFVNGRVVADDHCDSHGLAQGARQGQKDRPEYAGTSVRNDNLRSRFPLRCAQRQGGLALLLRNGEEHFAGNGNDEGDDHDSENHASREESEAIGRTLKKWEETKSRVQERLDRRTDDRDEDKNTEQAIDNAGHGSQEVNDECEPVGQPSGNKFDEENRCAQPQRNRNDQGEERGNECPVQERQRAKMLRDGVPDAGDQEFPSELTARETGIQPEFEK